MDVMFWVWLGVIIVTAIVEFATMEVVSIWFTIGAIIPFILAATGAVNWIWQVVIFVVLSAIMIVCLRSVTKKFLLKNSNEKTNVDSLIGQKVRMLSRTDFETVGSVKINDVVWSAIGFSQQTIEKDEIVTILSVQGNKLVVKKDKEEPEVVEVEEEKKPARKKSEKKESKHKTNEVAAENSAEKVEKKEVTEQKAENIEKDAEKVEKKKVPAKKPSKSKTKEPKKKIAATENDTEKVEKKVSTKKPAKSKVEETKKKATTTKKTSTKTSSKSKTTSSSTKNTKSATKNTKSATKSAANKRS